MLPLPPPAGARAPGTTGAPGVAVTADPPADAESFAAALAALVARTADEGEAPSGGGLRGRPRTGPAELLSVPLARAPLGESAAAGDGAAPGRSTSAAPSLATGTTQEAPGPQSTPVGPAVGVPAVAHETGRGRLAAGPFVVPDVPAVAETAPTGAGGPTAHPMTVAAPATSSEQGRANEPAHPAGAPADPARAFDGEPTAATPPARGDGGVADALRGGVARPEPPALVERVARIAQQLEQTPPPRQMTVEVGELRLSVSLRGEGAVRVVVLGDQGQALGSDWGRDLADALAERGFDLEHPDGGGRHFESDDTPPRPDGGKSAATPVGTSDDSLRL